MSADGRWGSPGAAGWGEVGSDSLPWGSALTGDGGGGGGGTGAVVDVAQQAALVVRGPVLTASGPVMKKKK